MKENIDHLGLLFILLAFCIHFLSQVRKNSNIIVNNTKCVRMTYNNLQKLHIPKLLFIGYVSLPSKWGAKHSNVVIF